MDILGVNEQTLETNVAIIERLIKSILWVVGGYKIYLGGNPMVTEKLKAIFSKDGMRKFDVEFMSKVYREPFEVITTTIDKVPTEVKASIKIGGNLDGYRIGLMREDRTVRSARSSMAKRFTAKKSFGIRNSKPIPITIIKEFLTVLNGLLPRCRAWMRLALAAPVFISTTKSG